MLHLLVSLVWGARAMQSALVNLAVPLQLGRWFREAVLVRLHEECVGSQSSSQTSLCWQCCLSVRWSWGCGAGDCFWCSHSQASTWLRNLSRELPFGPTNPSVRTLDMGWVSLRPLSPYNQWDCCMKISYRGREVGGYYLWIHNSSSGSYLSYESWL